ncbi:integrase catalytic domain-containing protein [Trichonephila clavipes]|nr:integrase catalytic domain-containing protein [Trichonephila clavipes]
MDSSIDPLDSDNFNSWSTDIKVLLMERNGWRIVTGIETKPEDNKKPKEQKDFEARKDRSSSTIYLNVSKTYRCIIDGIEDPIETRKRLEEHFRLDSRVQIIGLTDKFLLCRINVQEEIWVYTARMQNIVNQLKNAGRPIDEWYQDF